MQDSKLIHLNLSHKYFQVVNTLSGISVKKVTKHSLFVFFGGVGVGGDDLHYK